MPAAAAKAAAVKGKAGQAGPIRLFVFDFDQTLTTVHVFKTLAGWDRGASAAAGFSVPSPHCLSEIGQVQRIAELSCAEFREQGGFAQAAFGGQERVRRISRFLGELRGTGAELVLCTKGLVSTINKCLQDLDMQQHFTEVYGRLDNSYGSTPYDKKKREAVDESLKKLLGRPEQGDWRTKDRLIARLMEIRGLRKHEVVLVEDDPEEVKNAAATCQTFLVKEATGLQEEHCKELLRMAKPNPCPGGCTIM